MSDKEVFKKMDEMLGKVKFDPPAKGAIHAIFADGKVYTGEAEIRAFVENHNRMVNEEDDR